MSDPCLIPTKCTQGPLFIDMFASRLRYDLLVFPTDLAKKKQAHCGFCLQQKCRHMVQYQWEH